LSDGATTRPDGSLPDEEIQDTAADSRPGPFADIRFAIEERIDHVLAEYPQPASLYDPIRYIMGIGGKRIRPILVVISAEAVGASLSQVLDVAVAVELLHNFTLVHDDIMDQDLVRRGQPTIHARWDEGTAILAGDALIGIAYRCLCNSPCEQLPMQIRTFTEAVVEVCEGQALDKEFETSTQVDLAGYEDMIARKTGRLISMSTRIGAMAANAPQEIVDTLERYGTCIGKAFQIQDDLLDYLSSTEVLGKRVGSDLVMQKKTFVTLKALEILKGNDRKRFQQLLHSAEANPEGLLEMKNLLVGGGVLEAGQRVVDELFRQAFRILDEADPRLETRRLRDYAGWLLKRDY
jgi:geranylgeranyl diphosphate synthase type II